MVLSSTQRKKETRFLTLTSSFAIKTGPPSLQQTVTWALFMISTSVLVQSWHRHHHHYEKNEKSQKLRLGFAKDKLVFFSSHLDQNRPPLFVSVVHLSMPNGNKIHSYCLPIVHFAQSNTSIAIFDHIVHSDDWAKSIFSSYFPILRSDFNRIRL